MKTKYRLNEFLVALFVAQEGKSLPLDLEANT